MAEDIISTEELFGSQPEVITTEQLFGGNKVVNAIADVGEQLPRAMAIVPNTIATAIDRMVTGKSANVGQAIKDAGMDLAEGKSINMTQFLQKYEKITPSTKATLINPNFWKSLGTDFAGNAADIVGNLSTYLIAPVQSMVGKAIEPTAFGKFMTKPLGRTAIIPKVPPEAVKVTPPSPEVVATKEPWQMTREQFATNVEARQVGDKYVLKRTDSGKYGKDLGSYPVGFVDKKQTLEFFHQDNIKKALAQGKPVPPEVLAEYKGVTPAEFVYHGTTEGRARQIAKQGLLTGKEAGNTLAENIYLSNTEQYAKSYADRKGGTSGVILRIPKSADIIADPNTGLKGDFKTPQSISPANIEIKTKKGWKPITEQYQPPAVPEVTPAKPLGRLNPETFQPEVKPILKEAIAMKPEVTAPISDNTLRGMAASLDSRPLTEAILNKPEGQLAAEVMQQRAELTKIILDLPSKSLKDLPEEIPAVLQKSAEYARPGTEVGRALRMRKIDPQVNQQIWTSFTDRIKTIQKDPTINPNLKKTVIEGLIKIRKMQTDPTVNPTLANKIYYAWLNAILSNPMTHVRNTVGNIMFAADKVIETIPKVPIDIARSGLKPSNRTAWWGEIPAMVKGALSREKLPQEIMDLAKGTKIEGGAPISGIGGKIIGIPTTALQVEDNIFKTLIGRTELYRLRFLEGKGKFLGGKDVLHQTVADEMLYRTFQNDPSKLAQGIMNLRSSVPGARYVVPFIKTPSNLVNVAIERSPLQAVNILYKAIGKKYIGNQAEVSRDLARLTTGSAIAAWVASKYKQGKITGSAPKTSAERDAFYRQGKKPNSILVGDTWIPIGNLDPLGGVFSMVSNIIDAWESGEAENEAKILKVAYGIGQMVSTRTYLSGLIGLSTAIEDPERWLGSYSKNLLASAVPGGLKFWADLVDNNYRETNTQLATIINKIPYLSRRLPEKVSFLGEPQTGRTLGVTGAGKAKSSEFENRIANIMIGATSKKLGDQKLTPDQVRWIYQTSGPQIKQIITAIPPEQWYRLPPEIKEGIVSSVVNGLREGVRGQLRNVMPTPTINFTSPNIITTEQLFGQ